MHLDSKAALHLSPLLHGIETLRLEECQVNKSSLAVLGNCKHLKQLSLVCTKLAAGAGHALHVLATEGCPGLELKLDQVEDASPTAPYSFLASLAPCLTHLTVKAAVTQMLSAVLHVLTQKQYPRLQHLDLSGTGSSVPLPLVVIRLLASTCPQLQSLTSENIILPSLHCLRALFEMPQLVHLSVPYIRTHGAFGAAIRWPTGKQPVSLSLFHLTPYDMSVLPLEHCSQLSALCLRVQQDQTQQQLVDSMRVALLNAAKCPQVQVSYIAAPSGQLVPGAGLSALTTGCPLQCDGRASITSVALELADVQGLVAAWGASLTQLVLTECSLSAPAWAALASLPALDTLLLVDMQGLPQQGAHLAALFLAWPCTRPLRVGVKGEAASQWAGTWSDILHTHNRPNIKLVVME
jgi:hypothetical protein